MIKVCPYYNDYFAFWTHFESPTTLLKTKRTYFQRRNEIFPREFWGKILEFAGVFCRPKNFSFALQIWYRRRQKPFSEFPRYFDSSISSPLLWNTMSDYLWAVSSTFLTDCEWLVIWETTRFLHNRWVPKNLKFQKLRRRWKIE